MWESNLGGVVFNIQCEASHREDIFKNAEHGKNITSKIKNNTVGIY